MPHKVTENDLKLTANTIRGLAMDGVQKAKSGHPGLPMGMADVAAVLFLKYLEHSPVQPDWEDRDRFVLSGGHGSMLIYSMLHLSGYDLPLEELAAFRQLNSLTPGYPEYGHTPGVETTTGPLGQGCGNAVGMALAERMQAERFNTDEFAPVDHYTYAFCGDGDMMEGLSHEVFSLAGHLGLNKLIVFYDDNEITIEGATSLAFSEDIKKRFQSYKWNVIDIDGHDYDQIEKAIRKAKRQKDRPTLVITHTKIGYGSPNKQGTASVHGEPLGAEEIRATKQNLDMPADEDFYVPQQVRDLFDARLQSLKRKAAKWARLFKKYTAANEELAAKWQTCYGDVIPEDLASFVPDFDVDTPVATRVASGKVIQGMTEAMPQLVGGAADLAPSTKTLINDAASVAPGAYAGRNLHFGIREHAMGSIMNGMLLHGGLRVYGATFFVFADYCRPTIRLAAIMQVPAIYVFTHDSFFVGEDGPTHQPVEQAVSLRCIPGVTVIRPADATETGAAWVAALKKQDGPTAILLTRQNLPIIDRSQYPAADNLEKGAYQLWQSAEGTPDILLVASGSEVELALGAAKELASDGIVRVVSMPSWELFDEQPAEYRESLIPQSCPNKVVIEAGSSLGWQKYVGCDAKLVTLDHFGASGPYKELAELYGFSVENVVSVARAGR